MDGGVRVPSAPELPEPLLDIDPPERPQPTVAQMGQHVQPQGALVPRDSARRPLAVDDCGPPTFRPLPHRDPSGIGVEVLVGVELVTDVTLETLGVRLAVEGALPWNGIPVAHDPGRPRLTWSLDDGCSWRAPYDERSAGEANAGGTPRGGGPGHLVSSTLAGPAGSEPAASDTVSATSPEAVRHTGHAAAAAPPAAVWPPDKDSLASGVPIGEHLPPVLGPLTLLMGGEEALALVRPAGTDGPPVALGDVSSGTWPPWRRASFHCARASRRAAKVVE